MANYVEEFVAFLGWEVDDTELEGFQKQISGLGDMLKKATAVVVGAAGALTALTAVINQATAANIAMAKSVGVSSDFLENMGNIVKPLGFDVEHVTDLVEEMNNKIGESVGLGIPISGVADATKILGLEFKTLRELAPEDQFIAILDAAKNLENQQAAVSAVDILMGGEANKILGFLREQDEGLLQLIERQMKLNLLTEAGRAGAERFNNTFGEMKTIIGSAKAEFFGLLGDALAPLIEKYRDWVMANNALIKSKIAEWADRLGRAVSWVINVFTWFIGKVDSVVTALGGLEHVLSLVAVGMIAAFGAKTILAIGTFIKFMKLAGTEALIMNAKAMLIPLAIAAIIALFLLLGEDLYQFFTGGESALGKIGEKIAGFVHSDIRPGIANFLGMSPEELDMAFLKVIDGMVWFWEQIVADAEWAIDKMVSVISWLIDAAVEWVGRVVEFWSFMSDMAGEMRLIWSAVGQTILDWFSSIIDTIGNFINFIIASFWEALASWGEFGKSLNDFFTGMADEIYDYFAGIANAFVAFVTSLPAKLIAFVRDSVSGVTDIIKELPLVGSLFGDDDGPIGSIPQSSLGALSTTRAPQASAGAKAAAATINNSAQSVSRTTSQSNVFNVTQQPGESGERLAERVASELQKASARAVSINDSGIEV